MMAREYMSDEQMQAEIERLNGSELVKLAEKERRLKTDKMRKRLYQLRWLEKRGRQLAEAGVTPDNMEAWMQAMDAEGADPDE